MSSTASIPEKASKPNLFIRILNKTSLWSSVWFERIAMVGIVGIIVATLIDVIGAKIFHKPMAAGTEVVYFLQIFAIAGALAIAQVDNRHVRIEFIDGAPKTVRAIFSFITSLLGLGLFIILMWQSYEYGLDLKNANEVTSASRFPLYPFAYWIALSCIPLCLVLLNTMIKSMVEVVKK